MAVLLNTSPCFWRRSYHSILGVTMVAYLAPIQAEIVISSGCKQQIHVTDPAQIVDEQVRKVGRQIDGAFAGQLLHNRRDLRQTGFGFPTVYPHLIWSIIWTPPIITRAKRKRPRKMLRALQGYEKIRSPDNWSTPGVVTEDGPSRPRSRGAPLSNGTKIIQ